MKRRVLTGCRLHAQSRIGSQCVMLTLTYRDGAAWEGSHISACLRHVRQWCKRHGHVYACVWVAEIQEARKRKNPGFHCVHYHVVLWLPRGVKLPKPDEQGWWGHGFTRIESVRHAVGYIAKYASKGSDSASACPRAHACTPWRACKGAIWMRPDGGACRSGCAVR